MLIVSEKLDILNKNQLGLRPKKSTIEVFLSFIESVKQFWEDGSAEAKTVFSETKETNSI